MKSTNLKLFCLALSSLAFSATFAQDDTTSKPAPDTSNMPKTDTTSMTITKPGNSIATANVYSTFVANSDSKVIAKHEAVEDEITEKFFAKISA